MKIGDEVYPNMAIETIRVAVGDTSYQVKADDFGVTESVIYATINTDANARIWLRWNKEFKTISAASQDFSEAAGTTIIVALLTAEGLSSVIATPTGEQYDYVISVNSLQTILDGETITRFDSLIELLVAFVAGCVIVLICRYSAYWFIAVALTLGAVGGLNYVTMAFVQLVLFDITWILLTAFVVAFHSTFLRLY